MDSRRFAALAAAIVLLAAGLRLTALPRWSMNNDEIAEVRWSSLPFSEMMREVRRDAVHPPLDYVVQHLVGATGAPEWARRVVPALFGVAGIALAILLGKWWFSPGAGLTAGFLMAISVNHIRYSQEIRPYAMSFFFIFAALAALELFARTARRRWAVLWFAAVFLAGATLYFSGMIAGLTSLTRIFIDRKGSMSAVWRRLPWIIAGWTILYLPWLRVVLHAVSSAAPQGPDKLHWPWWQLRLQTLGTGDFRYEPVSVGSWGFWLAAMLGAIASIRRPLLLVPTVWLFGGGALSILVLQIRPHYSSPRYLLPAWLGAFLLAGAGLAWLWRRNLTKPLAAALVLLFAGQTTVTLRTYYAGQRPDWRGLAAYVHERVQPGESVILTNNWVIRNFGYYWQRLPQREGVAAERFIPTDRDFVGPAWIVTGQCRTRAALQVADLIRSEPMTDFAEVRYLRPGVTMVVSDEICPE